MYRPRGYSFYNCDDTSAVSAASAVSATSAASTSDESSGFSSFIAWKMVGEGKPPLHPKQWVSCTKCVIMFAGAKISTRYRGEANQLKVLKH